MTDRNQFYNLNRTTVTVDIYKKVIIDMIPKHSSDYRIIRGVKVVSTEI
jgi:hypothetical protein